MSDIDKKIKQGIKDNVDALIRVYRRVGVNAVNEARQSGSYQDRTSNLRGSTGYLIAVDGEVVDSLFEQPLGGYNKSEIESGHVIGEKFAKEILSEYQTGIVLIVVAGMNYAAAVESRGYNVLTSAELKAEKEINRLLSELNDYL